MAAGTAWDTVPIWEQKWPATLVIPVFIAGMPAKLTWVQLRRHARGKDWAMGGATLPAAFVLILKQYSRQYRRPCRRCIGGIWEPGLRYLKQIKMTTKFCSKVKHFLVLRYRDQSNLAEMRNPLSVQINALCSLCYWKSISCILKCYSALHRSVKLFQMKKKN